MQVNFKQFKKTTMSKTINFEKLKNFFEKTTIPDAIENYNRLGEFLHQLIEEERKKLSAENDSLKSIQEKLNKK